MPRLTILGQETCVEVQKGTRLLEICEERDLPVEISCRAGACGTCIIQVISSPQSLSPLSSAEERFLSLDAQRAKCRLACQCRIEDDVEISVDVDPQYCD